MNHRPLTPLQQAICFRVNGFGALEADRLRDNLSIQYRRLGQSDLDWQGDFNLTCDLLALYGILHIDTDANGARRLVSLQARPIPAATSSLPQLPRRRLHWTWPITTATTGMLVAAGCSLLPGYAGTPGNVPAYGDGAAPPSRIEQFHARGNMVYRYCQGEECPSPTPKRLATDGQAYANASAALSDPVPPAIMSSSATVAPGAPASTTSTVSTTDNNRHTTIAAALNKLKSQAGAPPPASAFTSKPEARQQTGVGEPMQPARTSAPALLAMADTPSAAAKTVIQQASAGTPSAPDAVGRLKTDPEFTSYKGYAEFANGSQVLDGLNKQKIAELATQARAAEQVRLRGHVARETLDEDMRKLAVGRAYAVKMEFARHDVSKDKIRILNPKAELVDAANPKASVNRSVDIFIDMPQQTKTPNTPAS